MGKCVLGFIQASADEEPESSRLLGSVPWSVLVVWCGLGCLCPIDLGLRDLYDLGMAIFFVSLSQFSMCKFETKWQLKMVAVRVKVIIH